MCSCFEGLVLDSSHREYVLFATIARKSRSYCRNILEHEFALLFKVCFFALGPVIRRHSGNTRPDNPTCDKMNEVKEVLSTIAVQCLLWLRTWMGCLDRAFLPPRLHPPPLFLARFASSFFLCNNQQMSFSRLLKPI